MVGFEKGGKPFALFSNGVQSLEEKENFPLGKRQPAAVFPFKACIDFFGLGDSLAGKLIRNIEILGVLKSGKYNSLYDDSKPIVFNQTVEAMYQDDINQSKLLGLFTGLSIVIANIGLFGLVALLNRRRMKEIGIQKVNGARRWLQNFATQTTFSWWIAPLDTDHP